MCRAIATDPAGKRAFWRSRKKSGPRLPGDIFPQFQEKFPLAASVGSAAILIFSANVSEGDSPVLDKDMSSSIEDLSPALALRVALSTPGLPLRRFEPLEHFLL
jgi:hypothetical protein